MRHVLITGATGTLGSELVPLFAKESDTFIYLLVRAQDDMKLQERFQNLLAFLGIPLTKAPNIIPIRGDVSEPQLGMDSKQYVELTTQCTHLVHAAATIKLNMTPEEAHKATLVPTENIFQFIDLCRKNGQFLKLDYVSTVGIAGKMQGAIEERFFPETREFHNNYERYKAKSEAIVWQQIQAGLPATIHRPSMIVGNSQTGRIVNFQGFYFLTRFISGHPTYGFIPKLPKLTVDTVPVDYVAAGIHWASSDKAALGKILHYSSAEQSLSFTELTYLVRAAYDKKGDTLPTLHWINPKWFIIIIMVIRTFCIGRLRLHLRHLLLFMEYMQNEQTFENTNTNVLLSEHNITLPAPENYLPVVLDYYLSKKLIPS